MSLQKSLDIHSLRDAAARLLVAMEREFDALNTADGALGDGDLGVTMARGMRAINELAPALPDDLGLALMQCAQAFTKTSGSSYGTLMATGLLAVAKSLKGKTSCEGSEISGFIAAARDAMQARGKAEIGGKTVIDSLDAMAKATAGLSEPKAVANAAADAAATSQEEMRMKLATIGRARIFGEKTIGMIDPGMLAMTGITAAIAGRS